MKSQTWIPILGKAGTQTEAGMTLVQFLILVAITAVFAVLCIPPWLEDRRVSQADVDVEVIAEAIQKYHKHTNQYPKTLLDLVENPGIEGWRYPYLEQVPQTPWRGEYDLLPEIHKVC
ncbi:MAG: type II secretion system protein GspG, partial [Candidatus Poribacteria bacterium]|nr:type II secretion system protein GspG [Candidatus Poribacteria bacterium]